MKLDMFNIRDFIKANKLVPVTDPVSLTSAKMPSPGGIFSYDIFGYTTEERKNTFSYVDLNGKFFHPECLKVFKRMGSLGKIVTRDKYAVVANKKIKVVDPKDFPDAETGTDFFYDNWDSIDWMAEQFSDGDETDEDEISIDKRTRLKFFKYLKKDEAFIDAWLVLPPFYRDMNSEDVTLGDDINKLYNRLISQTKALKSGFGFSSFGDITKDAIQGTINMLYDTTMNPVTGKTVDLKDNGTLKGNSKRSLIRRNLIGRFLDFSASSVITSPVSSTTQTENDFVKYGTVNLPLQTVMAMAKPFFINYCQNFLEDCAHDIMGNEVNVIQRIDPVQWSVTEVDKAVTRFIKTASEKDEPVQFEALMKDGSKKNVFIMVAESETKDGLEKAPLRPITYLDMFYTAGVDICKDKYSLDTRYPVTNNQNIYCAKVNVMSTNRSHPCYFRVVGRNEAAYYPHYPYISHAKMAPEYADPNPKPEIYYQMYRVTVIGNGVIKSLDADYDGDVLQFRMLFTKEANAEAEKLVWKKTNFFNAAGGLSRGLTKIDKDCVMSLYALTKNA
jgi:hypothetical protein